MPRRILSLTFVFLLLFGVCQARLYKLALDTSAADAAQRQSAWSYTVSDGRGIIYDYAMRPLTGTAQQPAAVVAAGAQDYTLLFDAVLPEDRRLLYSGAQASSPFVVRLSGGEAAAATGGEALAGTGKALGQDGSVFTFSYPLRYSENQLARHIIGYCNGEGQGVAGLERVFDSYLAGGADTLQARCNTNALTQAVSAAKLRRTQGTGNALQLSLDSVIQTVAEDVAAQHMTTGAILVLECATGRIKASVSMPQFDPYNVYASIQAGDTALVNRAFSSYSVGSVYKPLLAALALEKGLDAAELYNCTGSVTVDGHTYRCAKRQGHGQIDLALALEQSCNCYFIQLGQRLGGAAIVEFSSLCGFGQATVLGGSWRAGSGNLPDVQTLQNSGQLAGLSFGQGQLTATPLQLAAAFNIFANDGVYISPTLVEGYANSNTGKVTESLYRPCQLQVISPDTAAVMRRLLTGVVEQGLGAPAAIAEASVAGKTGTAQTGRTAHLADGSTSELYDSWFVGFYPAEAPRYTVAVLADSTTLTGEKVAPVFAALCRQLYYLGIG